MGDWSYSNQPPSYNQVHRPEFLWHVYYMEGYQNWLETVDELQHLSELRMKQPYRFRTHKEDLLAREYTKLNTNVLVIASEVTNSHRPLSQRHANVVSRTTACIYDQQEVVDKDSWR